MKPLLIFLSATALAGCQSLASKPPSGPCRLPDSTHYLGAQQFTQPGASTFADQSSCLAQGGTYTADGRGLLADQTRLRAQRGDAAAWIQLGMWAEHDRPPRFADASDAYRTAYRLGLREGAWHLGRMAEHGLGQSPDGQIALNWYQRAADGARLVPARELAAAKRLHGTMSQQLHEQQRQLLESQHETATHKTQLAATESALFRMDLGAQPARCGRAMDWRALGDSVAGFALALKQFDQHYSDQGWLWLSGDQLPGWASDPVVADLLSDFMQTRRSSVALSSAWAQRVPADRGPQPWVVMDQAAGIHQWRHTRIRFDCAL